jgi:hypothetical protein
MVDRVTAQKVDHPYVTTALLLEKWDISSLVSIFPTTVKGGRSVFVRVIGRMCPADSDVVQQFYVRIFGFFSSIVSSPACNASFLRSRGLSLVSLCSLPTERDRTSAKSMELCFSGNRDDY